MAATAWQGAVSPEALVITVTPGTSGVDLSTVTAATIYMCAAQDASTAVTTLSATLSAQTASSLTLTHAWASNGSETATAGSFFVYAALTLSGGGVVTTPRDTLQIRQRFAL